MMYFVHRRYLVALALAVVAAVAAVVVPRVAHTIHEDQVTAKLAAGERTLASAFKRLKMPAGFILIRAGSPLGADCLGRCYRVDKRTPAVAVLIPAIFRSVGVDDAAQHGICSRISGVCSFSIPIEQRPVVEPIDVFIEPLVTCRSLSTRCSNLDASEVSFSYF